MQSRGETPAGGGIISKQRARDRTVVRTREAAWDAAAVRAESMAANSADARSGRWGGSARKSHSLAACARERWWLDSLETGRGEEEVEETGGYKRGLRALYFASGRVGGTPLALRAAEYFNEIASRGHSRQPFRFHQLLPVLQTGRRWKPLVTTGS